MMIPSTCLGINNQSEQESKVQWLLVLLMLGVRPKSLFTIKNPHFPPQRKTASLSLCRCSLKMSLSPPPSHHRRRRRHLQEIPSQISSNERCTKCTLYRGEPVPTYWGSKDYPDRYFDNGRWGPPYALVQEIVVSDDPKVWQPPRQQQPFRPSIQRGMVAWAGGQGGPHFFVALADHPEWGQSHTVFATVLEDDMKLLYALVVERPLVTTQPMQPPIVTNFVDPIPITLRMS
ncbi:hypothetical protein IV203_019769 [Nitzschia inconspicua]|uniref:Uncharacterized protein n=1 Tax=Nitzschia inconspicua TaxID=303405 RepID=A0A9K3LZX1_9STRA|nr:hypothetical protein IV203_019769 [Nitzschia inconspicua]